MTNRRDLIVDALKKSGMTNPTDDDIDTAVNQFEYLCDPTTGEPRGDAAAVADQAVVKARECVERLAKKRAARAAELQAQKDKVKGKDKTG